ncbi:hypothetical protein ACFLVG_04240 [Chloroflexota bacterium]
MLTWLIDASSPVLIKMASSAWVTLKVSTDPWPPDTRVLKQGWNLVGAGMTVMQRELEMWQVLQSVANTNVGNVGYNMVVSPPMATQPSWAYVRGQEEVTGFVWEKMKFGRSYWIYMENQDEMAGFSSTPITARVVD